MAQQTKEHKRKFKGVWVPKEIWLNRELSLQEKVVFAEIDSLSTDDEPCFATNEYFAEFFGFSVRRVQQVIASLTKKGLVKSQINQVVNNRNRRKLTAILPETGVKNISPPQGEENFTPPMKKISGPGRNKFQGGPEKNFRAPYKEENIKDNKAEKIKDGKNPRNFASLSEQIRADRAFGKYCYLCGHGSRFDSGRMIWRESKPWDRLDCYKEWVAKGRPEL